LPFAVFFGVIYTWWYPWIVQKVTHGQASSLEEARQTAIEGSTTLRNKESQK